LRYESFIIPGAASRGLSKGDRVANPYRELLEVPGARIFVAAGFVGRMSMAMLGIGIVLLVSAVTGSYGIAGAVSATCALAFAAGSPFLGRLADRYGQRPVLVPLASAHAVAVAALVLCAVLDLPIWTLYPASALTGLTSPGLGAMVRARWIHVLTVDGGKLGVHTALSFESVLDELIFITGPILVTVLATGVHPAGGVIAAGAFTCAGSLVLAAQQGTQPPVRPVDGRARSAMTTLGVLIVSLVFLMLGAVFGAVDVGVIAYAEQEGHAALAGVLLAIFALGSCVAGLWYGARHWRAALPDRFLWGLLLLVAGLVPLAMSPPLFVLMALMLFSGLAISPTIIPGYGLIERLVPPARLTEGLALISTAVGLGVAAGASAGGRLVDAYGADRALLLPLAVGLVAVVAGLAGRSQLHNRQET
jgi:MFS family permease